MDKHVPLKKVLRANQAPYMTKTLRKAVLRRSQVRKKYFQNKSQRNYLLFKKQMNFCRKVYKKERKEYSDALYIKNFNDNKQFCKTNSFFPNIVKHLQELL